MAGSDGGLALCADCFAGEERWILKRVQDDGTTNAVVVLRNQPTDILPETVILNLFQDPSRATLRPMRQERQPCVYILASGHYGTLYIGITSNLPARIWQHREGTLPGFTSQYSVHRLVHFEMLDNMPQAIAREKQLKNWRRQWKINLIERENPQWRDLAVSLGFEPIMPRQRPNGS